MPKAEMPWVRAGGQTERFLPSVAKRTVFFPRGLADSRNLYFIVLRRRLKEERMKKKSLLILFIALVLIVAIPLFAYRLQ